MAYTEEYRELIENARDAVRTLLAESSEDSWLELRAGLREIRQAIRDDETRAQLEEELRDLREKRDEFNERREARKQLTQPTGRDYAAERRERLERKKAWRQMPMARKEGLIIEAIGVDQLRREGIAVRVGELVGWTTNSCVSSSSVDSLLKRLLASGQLDRVQLRVHGREVWHYFCKRDLTGPIADLEQAWHEGEAA